MHVQLWFILCLYLLLIILGSVHCWMHLLRSRSLSFYGQKIQLHFLQLLVSFSYVCGYNFLFAASFGSIKVAELDWGNKKHIEAVNPPFDYIIGTDIVRSLDIGFYYYRQAIGLFKISRI